MTPTNRSADPFRRRDRIRWSLLIFTFALLVRGLHLWQLHGSPLLDVSMGDARSYQAWAAQIAAGNWIGDEVFYQAPLYPYLLAALYSLFGDDPLLVRVLQSLLGAASCVFLARAGWRFFSRPAFSEWVGIAAGLLLAAYAPAIFADTTIQKSVLDLFLLSLALWILGGIVTRPRPRQYLGLGLAVGALALSRENALVFGLVLLPTLFLRCPAAGARRLVYPALFLVGMAGLLFPVALRNWTIGGELYLTTSQLGPNLYIGNNESATGIYTPMRPGRGDPKHEREDATAIAQAALGRDLTPAEVSRFFVRRSFDYVMSQPRDWARLMGRKLSLAFNAVEVVDTEDQYTHAEWSLPLRLSGQLLHFGVLAPLAFLGVWITWPKRADLWPLYVLFLAYTGSLLAFYVFARYRLPLAPFVVLFAAAGIVEFRSFLRESPRSRVATALLLTAAFAVFCNWPIVDKSYMRSVTHYNLGNELFLAGRTDEAIEQYRKAIRLHEENAMAYRNLGTAFARQGDLGRAKDYYEQALQVAPNYVEARFNLARVLANTGDLRGAIESYERGLRVEGHRAPVYNELGLVFSEIGELAAAIESFRTAIAIDPDLTDAHANLMRAIAQRDATVDD